MKSTTLLVSQVATVVRVCREESPAKARLRFTSEEVTHFSVPETFVRAAQVSRMLSMEVTWVTSQPSKPVKVASLTQPLKRLARVVRLEVSRPDPSKEVRFL